MKIAIHHHLSLIIVLSFIFVAILNTVELIHFREIPVFQNGDLCFHWQRTLELINSHHLFPYYAMNSFKDSGSAVMTMYPYLWLYPVALVYSAEHSIILTTIVVLGLNTLASLLISYYGSLTFSHSRVISYLFATMYSLSFPLFLNTVDSYAVGMNDAFIIMPLVIFGFLSWLRYGRWLMLAIGMSGLVYSEVLITAFIIGLFILWALINVYCLNRHHIVNLVKAVILTLLLTALFWLPAVHLYFTNRLIKIGSRRIKGVDLGQSFGSAFNIERMVGQNNVHLMTIYVALGLFISLAVFFYGRRLHKQMYAISVLVILLSSNLFPWPDFRGTVLSYVQFPWRFYLVPQMILTYLLAESLIHGLRYIIHSRYGMRNVLLIIIAFVIGLQLVNQHHYFTTLPNDTRGSVIDMNQHRVLTLNDIEYHDYYPQRTVSKFHQIERHMAMLPNGRPVMKFVPEGHGKYIFGSHHNYRRLVMPFIMYNGTQYHVNYDGHLIQPRDSQNALLMLKHVQPGRHQIQIIIEPNKAMQLSKVLTAAGLLICLVAVIEQEIKRRAVKYEN